MADRARDVLDALRTYAEGGERCGRPAAARAAELIDAYRTAALHYMGGECVVDCREVGGAMTWGVGGRELTDAEAAALTDLWHELGEECAACGGSGDCGRCGGEGCGRDIGVGHCTNGACTACDGTGIPRAVTGG